MQSYKFSGTKQNVDSVLKTDE